MKILVKKIDEIKGILQITTLDERFYGLPQQDGSYKYYPSSSWIASYYPKGIAYFKWLANHGWDESESLKNEAAEKGSKVHQAVEDLLKGKVVKIDSRYTNKDGNSEELTPEEYECLMSFIDWHKEYQPVVTGIEQTVINEKDNYAGMLDLLCTIKGEQYIIDFKTSQYIWPSHEIQIASYREALGLQCKMAVLQLGYRLNKKKYKFTEIQDKYYLFLAAKQIWAEECSKTIPLQKDYPLILRLS
jgi:hypothetical protein